MTVSVVVPTHGRPSQLAGCLEALADLDFERDRYEVIVVDDGSPEPLDRVSLPSADRCRVRVVRQRRTGPGGARNAGARAARGRLLAFTDDDCRPASGWLSELAAQHAADPARLIGGRTVNDLSHNAYATTSQIIVDVAYAHYNQQPGGPRFFASNNMAVPADLFREVGGFDEGFAAPGAEDRELCDRWLHRGHRLAYAPDAIVSHRHDLTLARFCRQHFNYGRGALRFHRARAARGSGTLRSEIVFHGRFLARLREPLSRLRPVMALRVCALLGLWQLVNASGYLFALASAGLGTSRP